MITAGVAILELPVMSWPAHTDVNNFPIRRG
jgi:hypothetical protein